MSLLDFSSELIEDEKDNSGPIKNFFRNKNIFLTGGTGFLGLLYVEKLLRSDAKMIYLLIRSKKNIDPIDRIKKLFTGIVFQKLANHDTNYLQRIRIIEGDLSQLKLGISDENLEDIYNNVDIVIHAAADVRFEEKLMQLLLVNLRGTRELLKICEKIKNLQIMTYISTAYSNCYRNVTEEKIYDCLPDPDRMIALAEKISLNPVALSEFEIITDRIIKPFPNSYTFSKNLSEMLVKKYSEKLNVCIMRPTIVISTFDDPVPGWCNNLYGLNGAFFAIGLGFCRLLPARTDVIIDIVCADYVINSTLAATWYVHNEQTNKSVSNIDNPAIFHVSTSMIKPVTFGSLAREASACYADNAPDTAIWKLCYNVTRCPFMWKYLTIWYHLIPSLFFDCYFSLANKKIRILPIYRKSHQFMNSITFFITKHKLFTSKNMIKVWDSMNDFDKEFYLSDVRNFDWPSYCFMYVRGLLKYLGKDPLDKKDPKLTKRRQRNFFILHCFVLCIYYGIHILTFLTIANHFGIIERVQNSYLDMIEVIKNPR